MDVTSNVQTYYGETLQSTADLRTDACTTASAPRPQVKAALAAVHDEVMSRYYGCGLAIPTELEGLRVVASSVAGSAAATPVPTDPKADCSDGRQLRRAWVEGGWREVAVVERGSLPLHARQDGPALVVEQHSATWLAPGWSCEVDAAGALALERDA